MLRDRIAAGFLWIAWPVLYGIGGLFVLSLVCRAFVAGYGLYLLAGAILAFQILNVLRIATLRDDALKLTERLRILTRRHDILDVDLFNTKERLVPIVSHPWFRQQEANKTARDFDRTSHRIDCAGYVKSAKTGVRFEAERCDCGFESDGAT